MDLPADVTDRINRNWSTLPPDVQERLTKAGIAKPETQALATRQAKTVAQAPSVGTAIGQGVRALTQGLLGTTPEEFVQPSAEPGLPSVAGEMIGGTVGEVGGPLGSGAGTLLGGTLGDIASGAPLSAGRSAMRFGTGTLIPPAVGYGLKGAGALAGATTRAVVEKLPSFAKFAERVAPGVLRQGSRALEATGGLAKEGAETVINRFRDWSKVVFDHVNTLAGDAPVVPTASFKAAAEGLKSVPGFSLAERKSFQKMLESDVVPFTDARNVESAFQRLTRKSIGARAMGDPVSHQWATLKDAVSQDLETYLATPEAEVSGVGKALNEAKATYREGKQAISATEIYRKSLTPEGHFDARKFANSIKRLDDKGILSRVMGADRAPELRQLAEEFGKQTAPSRTVAGKIGLRLGAPAAAVLGTEQLYQHGQLTPERVATGALTLGMLHPLGRALMSSLAGQGLAAGARHALAPEPSSDFLNYLKGQGFTP